MPARSSVAGAERSGFPPSQSTFNVQALDVPAVAIAPATSSRYFEAAAIMARAESLTVEGAWLSAQLIEPSAVALLAAVRDHFQKLIVGPQKQKPRQAGPQGDAWMRRGGSSFPLVRVLINRPACPPSGKPDI